MMIYIMCPCDGHHQTEVEELGILSKGKIFGVKAGISVKSGNAVK